MCILNIPCCVISHVIYDSPISYDPPEKFVDYFPLAVGNKGVYEWRYDYNNPSSCDRRHLTES
jgi:hypothetical protein